MYCLLENHDDFLVISKSPGVSFHKGTAALGLIEKIRKDLGTADIYPVHRLDAVTSGLLLFARSKDSQRELSRLFSEHLIKKTYLAIGGGKPKKKQGTISGDMIRARNGAWKLVRGKTNPAVTTFRSYSVGDGLRLYVLYPQTGKTHQIRVALKSIGAPVLGDTLYAGTRYDKYQPDRAYLHAYAIEFEMGGKTYRFEDVPREGKYWQSEGFGQILRDFTL